jgi:aromatic-L-amino-acid decarboxylase
MDRHRAELRADLAAKPRAAVVRYRPPALADVALLDRLNDRLLHALNGSCRVYLTQNRVRGRYVIRFTIGQLYTTRAHVARAWRVIAETARGLPDRA